MSKHPEFLGAGSAPGLEIWRIENKVPKPWPKEKFGTFYTGDSYICLKTIETKGGSYEWDLHFWLGKESSVDEMGIAAYKTVELDDSLGGAPVQYRETQDHESAKFLALFKQGITYLDGGVDSGFKHVERDKYDVRLFHLKGKRNVRIQQVKVHHESLNSGDVFILDDGLTLYQWNGRESNKYEKAKGLDVVLKIKDDERGGRAKIVPLDEGSETEDFWKALGGQGKIKSAEEAGDDETSEKKAMAEQLMQKVGVEGGKIRWGDIHKPISHATLMEDSCFLVDSGTSVFVWVGKSAPQECRKMAMTAGMEYVSKEHRPSWTPVVRISQGTESPLFTDLFPDWPRKPLPTLNFTSTPTAKKNSVKRQSSNAEIAAGLALRREDSVKERQMLMQQEMLAFGDGSGKVEVWRIDNFDMTPVPEASYGQFYSGDSYIILYSYLDERGRDAWVIYFWLGRHSSRDEIGTAAFKAKELDDKYGGAPIQVRVEQNKEPLHLLRLFKGKFIVHEGGNPSGFRNAQEELKVSDGTGLYHIRGTNELNTRAVQVECKTSSLNSSDVFVLADQQSLVIWYGRQCNKQERDNANTIAEVLRAGRKVEHVEEGQEAESFWERLGGKEDYPEGAPDEDASEAPRLFHCSNASGVFEAEELLDFSQDDLQQDDVYILDVWREVFVWVGPDATELEKKSVMELAATFIELGGEQRKGTPIIRVSAGSEPGNFTCHFLGWDHAKARVFEDPYEKRLQALQESRQGKEEVEAPSSPFLNLKLKSNTASPSSATASPAPVQNSPFGQVKLRQSGVTLDLSESSSPAALNSPSSSSSKQVQLPVAAAPPAPTSFKDHSTTKFTWEQLKSRDPQVESAVDPTCKPLYLSDDEFKTVMGCTRVEYINMKKWKQDELKKKAGLF
uniref:HP domain-containing protein n=1 Tax=Guillardia theta TaxID=55529 RepID=A0A7S4KLT6_GUITH|mmetsp:Transcript_26980/g.88221  ORF Transcript_26980/g.88221 Transcript_26980/m.88221 type:complete len:901 (+) Transcript_26980:3-2705(+)